MARTSVWGLASKARMCSPETQPVPKTPTPRSFICPPSPVCRGDVHGLPFCLSREHHKGVPLLCTARSAFTGEGQEMQIRNRPPRDSIRNHFYVPTDESSDNLGSSRKRGEGSGAQLMKNILLLAFNVILSLFTLPSA